MAGHFTTSQTIELLSNEIARRAGLLLSSAEIRKLGIKTPHKNLRAIFAQHDDEYIERVTDIMSDLARALRVAVGNLPDDESSVARRIRKTMELSSQGHDVGAVMELLSARVSIGHGPVVIDDVMIKDFSERSNQPIWVVCEVVSMLVDHLDREWNAHEAFSVPLRTENIAKLSDLFDTELTPKDSNAYIDQRFIDYLAAREESLQEVHWRNFERICAEFFRQEGYVVSLGPGRDDGGVDLRVWKDDEREGAPFLLIQCKRYKNGKDVSVETVKSLQADVVFERARGGLVITTSRVAPVGRRVVEERKYPLGLVEAQKIHGWIKTKWRYHYNFGKKRLEPGSLLDRGRDGP